MACAKKSKNTYDFIRKVFNAGCVSMLYSVYNVEARMVSKLSIDDAYTFYEMKSKIHTSPLAVFYWNATYDTNICKSFAYQPRECTTLGCPVHGRCIVCRDKNHVVLEMYNGLVTTRCTVVKRINEELEILRESWKINDAMLWRFFDSLK